jgi:hypothetical protein
MKGSKRYRIGAESGVSLSGLIVVLIVLGALALVVIKVTPAFFEYRAVKNSIVKAKAEAGSGNVRAIQQAFDRHQRRHRDCRARPRDHARRRRYGNQLRVREAGPAGG